MQNINRLHKRKKHINKWKMFNRTRTPRNAN